MLKSDETRKNTGLRSKKYVVDKHNPTTIVDIFEKIVQDDR